MIRMLSVKAMMVPIILLLAFHAKSQSEPASDSVLKGIEGKLVAGGQAYVKDAVFFNPSLKPTILGTNQVSNIVSFRINEFSNRLLPDSFKVDASLRIIYTNSNNLKDSVNKTLTINYYKSKPYTAKTFFSFSNAYEVNVKVLSLTAQYAPLDTVVKVLELENEMILDRDYKLDCSTQSIHTIAKDTIGIDTSGELRVSWLPAPAAEEYDLEWTYIDKSAIQSGRYNVIGNLDPNLLFKFNATRVTVTGIAYNIPLLYDGDGKLYFRVRGAQTRPDGRRVTTPWSSDFISDGGLGNYDYVGHERKINWQSSTSFAEDGKRKSVVQYFDGSLKGRQTVTKDNTTGTTIVAETLYDQQGRPVIQIMPAPTLSSIIKFTPRFNGGLNSVDYDQGLYDTLRSAADYCATGAPQMDTTKGVSNYYGPSNPKLSQGFHQYIPNAHGYAFTETKYEQDNTGRITAQGGVGSEYQLGSNRETKYFYGEPDAEDLDALFGTEAGDYSHYQKNMVRDANGQYSVSYVDMHGRTVATALAGPTPGSLQPLSSYTNGTVTTSLLNSTNNLIKGTSIESVKGMVVTRGGLHNFSYQLSPESLGLANCASTTVCYDCLYDLEITVSDDCGNQNMPGDSAYKTIMKNFSFGAIDKTCTPAQALGLNFSLNLSEGSYTITKRLSVNEEAMKYYRDSVYLVQNSCKSYNDIVNEQTTVIKQQLGNCAADTLNEYDYLSYRQQMLDDMTPSSGQYADVDRANSGYSIFNTRSGEYLYQQIRDYKDGDGNPAFVTIDGVSKSPGALNPEEFNSNFSDSWADALLPLHPEYKLLITFEKLAASHIWDEDFVKTDTYAEALAKGYLNPTGNTTNQPAAKFTVNNTDSLFAALTSQFSSADASAARQYLNDSLLNFGKRTDAGAYSLWSVVTMMVKCPAYTSLSDCATTWSTDANAFGSGLCQGELDMAWRLFRMNYQKLKQDWIDKFIRATNGDTSYPPPGYVAVFPKSSEVFKQLGISNLYDTSAYRPRAQAGLNAMVDSSCHQYAQRWILQLGSCNYPADSLNNVIIPRLIEVCKQGGDASHPLGASTVKPGSTYAYTSFDDVITQYNLAHGITTNAACNAYLIDQPKPYNQPTFITNQPTYSKPDSCTCSRISLLYTQYQSVVAQYTSFSNYMLVRYKTVISNGALDTLRNLCNGTITCNYIPQMIQIPPAMQCGVGETCVSCSSVKQLYDTFLVKFPGAIPTKVQPTPAQDSINRLFQTYLNQKLGFSKSTIEYLTFMDSCNSSGYSSDCDSLAVIREEYRKILIETKKGIAIKGYKLTPVKDEVIDGINGLLEWNHRATSGRTLTSRYGYVPVSYVHNNKFYSIAWSAQSGSDSAFNITMPVNFDYVNFADTTVTSAFRAGLVVRDTDFVGTLKTGDLLKKYYGTGLRDEWGRFRFMWAADGAWYGTSGCLPSLATYYGFNTPPSKYLLPLCQQINNGYFFLAFYKMPQATPTITEYNSFRTAIDPVVENGTYDDRIPAGPLKDSLKNSPNIYHSGDIKKVLDFYVDSSLLAQYNPATNNFADTANTRFMRAKMLMMNGDTVSAYVYDNLIFNFKQKVDTNIYSSDCQKGFTAYYNSRKGTHYTFTQLDSLSNSVCGNSLSVCDTTFHPYTPSSNSVLCGKEAMDIPAVITQHDACSDSTLLIATTATEIYKAYRDSLIGVFNEAYTAKCLNAGTLESFTVNKPVSEYHYTLYYYDQAGNLIKTISPEGVHPNRDSTWLSQVRQKRAVGDIQIPTHTLPVVYRYNSLNQVITQNSPDGGYSKFWYDRLGRLVVSQNAKQLAASNYSYTRYDYLGRITEVGEKKQVTAMTNTTSRSQSSLLSWLNYTYTQSSQTILAQQVTRTVYDVAATLPLVSGTTAYNFHQKSYTIRNRVSNTLFYDVLLPGSTDPQYAEYTNGSYYSYDIHGNVDTLLQDYRLGLMASNGANRFKLTAYNYDLISGKVNQVHYQPGEKDQFYHRYEYDAENRITDVFTTNIKEFIGVRNIEDHEAVYQYYKHGPLARTLLGQQQVQGIDYAYTLQGWLKGVNSTSLMPVRDMGADDGTFIARDAYSFSLNYFTGDYSAINGARDPFPGHTAYFTGSEYKALYNGNISSMTVNISKFAPQLYNYRYDQLNRLISMDAYVGLNQTNNSWASLALTNNYKERVSYDANGNILSYLRNGTTAGGKQLAMDNLTYNYFTDASGKRNNRLRMVRDSVNNNNYTEDIDDQLSAVNNAADSNYVYDEIGNLVQDKAEKITSIKWNVYGKILEINKTATLLNPVTKISYTYDAAGNRISKKTEKGAASETTWYVRDAQGNVLGVYTDKNSLTLTEHHIYGSSRLGIANRDLTVADPSVTGTSLNLLGNSYLTNFERGKKFFELSNHLGNVLVTISDRKLQVINASSGNENNGGCEVGSGVDILSVSARNGEASYTARTEVNLLPGFSSTVGEDYVGYIDNSLTTCVPYTPPTTPAQGWYYAAEIVGANDYYPFGMLMPGKKFSSSSYRYGFNGQEKSDEIKGDGNSYTAEFWEYDPRTCRRWNLDPKPSVGISQYSAFNNNPIFNKDVKGDTIFRPAWMPHTFEDPLKNVLYQTPLGKQLLDEYSKSSSENIYFYAFDLAKSGSNFNADNQAIMNTVNDAQLKGMIDSKGNLILSNWDAQYRESGEQQLKYLNASGFHFNTTAALSIVGLNTTDNEYLKYDKYDLAFTIFHELYAHIKLGKTLKNGGMEHYQFGNLYYSKGMRLNDEEIVGGTVMVKGSPAWKIFRQLLELKINNGDGTAENKSDLKQMIKFDNDAAKAAAIKNKNKIKKN